MFYKFSHLLFILTNCLANYDTFFDDNNQSIRSKRGVRKFYNNYPKPIPYGLRSGINATNIYQAFSDLESLTCLTFEEKNFTSNGIVFKKSRINRVVRIGGSYRKPTYVKLNSTCLDSLGCVKHMLGLALGLNLETSRYDRDNYVELLKENLWKKDYHWYQKRHRTETWIRNTGFDYGSLMTNPYTWKSKNGEPVLKSNLSKYYDFMLGQRVDYSFNDIKQLNDYYCGDVCKSKVKGCTNGGYPDPKRCKKCRCPPGYIGQQCTQIRYNKDDCGKRIRYATRDVTDLIIEGKKDCFFYIRGPRYKKVRIGLPEVNTKPAFPCVPGTGVEIRYRHNKGATGLCLCGHYRKYTLNLFNSRVLVHYTGQTETDRLHIKYRYY